MEKLEQENAELRKLLELRERNESDGMIAVLDALAWKGGTWISIAIGILDWRRALETAVCGQCQGRAADKPCFWRPNPTRGLSYEACEAARRALRPKET